MNSHVPESVFIIIWRHCDQSVFLQHRDEHAPRNPDTWSLWCGRIEEDETPSKAACRELHEELTISLAPSNLVFFKTFSMPDRIRHVFVLQDDGQYEYSVQEGRAGAWHTIEEVKQLELNELSRQFLSEYKKSVPPALNTNETK